MKPLDSDFKELAAFSLLQTASPRGRPFRLPGPRCQAPNRLRRFPYRTACYRTARERFRLSEVEAERRQAMAPFVIEESSGFYVGRELKIPEH